MENPFDSALFWPTIWRVVGLLAVALVVVAAVERKPYRELRTSTLFVRVRSWALIAPVYVVAVIAGGLPGLLLLGYVVIQGLTEYARLVGLQRRYAWFLLTGGGLTVLLTGLLSNYFLFAPLAFMVLVTMLPILTGKVEQAHYQVTSTLFGYIYIAFALCYTAYVRQVEVDGVAFLLIVGVAVALSDVFAFAVGSAVGGRKLAPTVSPNKTWAGAGGNVIGAYAGVALMWFAVPAGWTTFTRVAAPLVLGVAALWGDLIESLVKRDFGVKDAGGLLPGFGGLLDRVDSLLISLPLTYYFVVVAQHYTAS